MADRIILPRDDSNPYPQVVKVSGTCYELVDENSRLSPTKEWNNVQGEFTTCVDCQKNCCLYDAIATWHCDTETFSDVEAHAYDCVDCDDPSDDWFGFYLGPDENACIYINYGIVNDGYTCDDPDDCPDLFNTYYPGSTTDCACYCELCEDVEEYPCPPDSFYGPVPYFENPGPYGGYSTYDSLEEACQECTKHDGGYPPEISKFDYNGKTYYFCKTDYFYQTNYIWWHTLYPYYDPGVTPDYCDLRPVNYFYDYVRNCTSGKFTFRVYGYDAECSKTVSCDAPCVTIEDADECPISSSSSSSSSSVVPPSSSSSSPVTPPFDDDRFV